VDLKTAELPRVAALEPPVVIWLFCFFEMSLHTESGLSGTGQARAVLRPAVSHFRRELAAVSAQHFESTREKGRAAAQLRARNLTARTCN